MIGGRGAGKVINGEKKVNLETQKDCGQKDSCNDVPEAAPKQWVAGRRKKASKRRKRRSGDEDREQKTQYS